MNNACLLLNILFFGSFTSLYSLTIMGMERKHTKQQIIPLCKNFNKKNTAPYINILNVYEQNPCFFFNINTILPTEILKNVTTNSYIKTFRELSRRHAKEYANNPLTWSFMPTDVEEFYDLCHAALSKTGLILSFIAKKDNYNSIKWIIDNIQPTSPKIYNDLHSEIDPIIFAKKNNNATMGEALSKLKLKILGHSEEEIATRWENYYNFISIEGFSDSVLAGQKLILLQATKYDERRIK